MAGFDDPELGRKFDQEKPRWDLVELSILEPAVRVLTMGAKKYAREIDCDYSNSVLKYIYGELEQCQNANRVSGKWGSGLLRACVAGAMKKICAPKIPSLLSGNGKIVEHGLGNTRPKSRLIRKNTWKIQSSEIATGLSIVHPGLSEPTGLRPNRPALYMPSSLVAQYATGHSNPGTVTLTTTIQWAKSEAFFVIVATGALECLEILKNVCTRRFGILGNALVKPSSPGYKIIFSGQENWKHVPDAGRRYFAALMRHLTAYQAGERTDPESGESHLAHALCCVMFLSWLEKNPQ